MKALSIKQPWAWAILNGKPIENRNWPTRLRGPFLIHTGKTFDHEGYKFILDYRDMLFPLIEIPSRDGFKMGGIIGKAKIVNCVDSHNSPFFFGPWGFVLKDIESLPFYPCKGKLGFFNVDYTLNNT